MISISASMLSAVSLLTALGAGAAAGWSVFHLRRLHARHAMLASKLAAALRELELLAAGATNSGLQGRRTDRDCAALADRIGVLESRGGSRLYNQAIDSARNGADPAKLARQFGLSKTEAKLLRLVHGGRSASP